MHIVMAGDFPTAPNKKISGGVEAVTLYLTRGLQHYPDLKLDIITLDQRGTAKRTVKHENITVHYLPRSGLPGYLSILANIRQMRAEMIRIEPDLVHAHVAGEYAEAAAISGLPWVLTPHGIRFREVDLRRGFLDKVYRGWFVKREERRTIKRAKHLISITPFIQSTFNGQIRGKVYNIENPIPETFFNLPRNGHSGQLLFAGRLIPLKGVHTLLRAFAKVHRRLPKVTLRLAGENASLNESGTYYQELKQFVAKAGLEKAVIFLGELDQPTLLKEYTNCSTVVLSSVVETSPMVIMEAMAAGKAVVSTDAGGARYLVEHGQTGLIVPVNDEQALAEAIYQVLSDETKVETMGRRAREVATQRFHAKVVAARTREVYYSMLGQHPPQLSGNDHELQ